MERTEENNATKDRFAHVGKIFSEMDSEKLQAEIAERSKTKVSQVKIHKRDLT